MIFNKNSNGDSELKQLLGFIGASVEFKNIVHFIPIGERELIPTISKAVYQLANDHYTSSAYETPITPDPELVLEEGEQDPEVARKLLDDLVHLIQLPLALHAYRRYVPSGDLSHSDAGRQIHVTESEKPAFEWMIDKDDLNMLNLAYEHTEILLDFLNENKFEAWTSSDQYVQSKSLFITSTGQFHNIIGINNSARVYFSFVPLMKKVERDIIASCFKADKYKEIKDQMKGTEDIPEDNKTLISLACEPVAYFTIAEAVKKFNLEFLPEGIFQNEKTGIINGKKAASTMDRFQASQFYSREGMLQLSKLQKEIAKQNNVVTGSVDVIANMTDRMSADKKYLSF